MNHDLIQQKLLALYDGPLTEKERKLVEGHLAQCRDCRKAVAQWKAISARLFPTQTLSEVAEDYFVAKVMDRVRSTAQEKGISPLTLIFRWLMPLVGSAVVAGWVFFSVLPGSAGASSSSVAAAFSYDSSETSPTGNGIILASYSTNEIAP
ncbi:MAG TPA: zf-HC2 domain-containing protein [bacterium]|nr:zf-HC2 domain-containing protein [bacterium]